MSIRRRPGSACARVAAALVLLQVPALAQVGGPAAQFDASVPTSEARFGSALDADGARALVGALGYGSPALRTGAASVVERERGAWVERAFLVASDAGHLDEFGFAVAIDGDRALVGAHGWDAPAAPDAGAAYVFERQTDGTWLEVARLVAALPGVFAHLGWSVALDGDRAVVGAVSDSAAGVLAGAALVFERQADGTWLEVAKLADPLAQFGDSLGHAVALAGDDALVAAPLDDDAASSAGAVHVFRRDASGAWSHVQQLSGGVGQPNARFGQSIGADGATAVIGTALSGQANNDPGRVYVFERDAAGVWSENQVLFGKTNSPYFGFGLDVDLADDLLVVGSRRNAFGSSGTGMVRAFRREVSGAWTWLADAAPSSADTFDRFGSAVAVIDDDEFLGGAWGTTVGGASTAGRVYATRVSTLMQSAPTVSVAAPTAIDLVLFGGVERAGGLYVVAGSVSGTGPTAFEGIDVPLTFDAYTDHTLFAFGVAPLLANVGVLDSSGTATARFELPAGLASSFVGLTVHHAAIVIVPPVFWPPSLVTEPIGLVLVP
jgi:hypothetical protein